MADKPGIGEIFDLVKDYAKQETLDPLKGIGKWLAFGAAGSVLLAIGLIELALAMLRALQTETGTALTGNLSWIPPLLTVVGIGIVCGALAMLIKKETLQ